MSSDAGVKSDYQEELFDDTVPLSPSNINSYYYFRNWNIYRQQPGSRCSEAHGKDDDDDDRWEEKCTFLPIFVCMGHPLTFLLIS